MLERLSQVKPKILFSVNGVLYNGKAHDHLGKLKEVVGGRMFTHCGDSGLVSHNLHALRIGLP